MMSSFAALRNNFSFFHIGLFASLLFLGLSDNTSFSFLAIPAFVILLGFFVCLDEVKQFYILVALIPFYDNLRIASIGIGFLLLLISSIKIIKKYGSTKVTALSVCALVFVLLNQFFNDFFTVTIGTFVNDIFKLLYFCVFLLFFPIERINRNYIISIFLISLILVQIVIIYHFGGNLAVIALDEEMVRLGEISDDGHRNSLGGAMGFPIYTILIITTLLYKVFNRGKYSFAYLVIILTEIIVTFFTVSKVYILGLAIVCMLLFVYLLNNLKVLLKFIPVFVLLFLAFAYYEAKYSYIEEMIVSKYTNRISGSDDVSTGRFDIYKSCLEYLSSDITSLLSGDGIKGYLAVGSSIGAKFEMSAHNLYLDGIMSFGVLGFLSLFYLYWKCINRICRSHSVAKTNILLLMPIIAYLVMVNTGGSFSSFKTYIYILYLSIYSFYLPKCSNYR